MWIKKSYGKFVVTSKKKLLYLFHRLYYFYKDRLSKKYTYYKMLLKNFRNLTFLCLQSNNDNANEALKSSINIEI